MATRRPSKSKLASRHGPLRGSGGDRENTAKRRVSWIPGDALTLLRNPSRETSGWAKGGVLTAPVLRCGELRDLQTLVTLGARFTAITWNYSHRIKDWSSEQTKQWLTLLFDNGWNGRGGTPEPLLSVAQYHPELCAMWKEKAPKSWQTKRNWLDGHLVMGAGMSPERIGAWLEVGASPGGEARLNLLDWFAQSKDENEILDTLRAVRDFMTVDKARHRVRGEPAFRGWPWEATMKAALTHEKMSVVNGLREEFKVTPPTIEQIITLVVSTRNPIVMLDRIAKMEWRMPHPHSAMGSHFVNQAILRQSARPGDALVHPEALALHLIDQGYRVSPCDDTLKHLSSDKSSPELQARVQSAQMRHVTPEVEPPRASAPRRRL